MDEPAGDAVSAFVAARDGCGLCAAGAAPPPQWFATSDPPGEPLGSGGGTAHLLVEAWRATGGGAAFGDWLRCERKLLIHGGGQSRRLPAYAVTGKILMPLPAIRWLHGQRLDQTLLDLQLPDYERVVAAAPAPYVALITSGDVLLRFARQLPALPVVDVLCLGMWVKPEQARHHGVCCCPRARPHEMAFFLQKPEPARLRELATGYFCLVDTGMWLLSQRAVELLLRRCGWDAAAQRFLYGRPNRYELYAEFGLSLGSHPLVPDAEISALRCAVVPLPEAEFYHFGATRQMIESTSALQNRELDEHKLGLAGARRHPDQFVQNTSFQYPLRREENHTLWVENSVVPATWKLACEHVLTGVPDNDWDLALERGVCLDFVPVGDTAVAMRAYGVDDPFRGALGDPAMQWFHRPARDWFAQRGIKLTDAGLAPGADIQEARLFPVLEPPELSPRFLEWLFAAQPGAAPGFRELWLRAPRVAAQELMHSANVARLQAQRAARRRACILPLFRNARWSVFFRLDLESTARDFAQTNEPLPPASPEMLSGDPLHPVHEAMFRVAVLRHRGQPGWEAHEAEAFARLRELIIREAQLRPALPQRSVLEDQIVWARSPLRLDLAGGWTGTPPYCLEHGGRVLNLGVNLNRQPPIQVFAKLCPRPELVLRSIDLGVEQRITTYAELDTFAQPGSELALAKAALALAGFLPRFHATGGYLSLRAQLEAFGGGIEISMLSAAPKGSGLGSSSILAATLQAAVGDLCGLGWDRHVLFQRTLALEQMLTTGGGWQDQGGAIFPGIKLIETARGLAQTPVVRWLPPTLFESEYANKRILLYYTGYTRLARNILAEIVRGIFLNSPAHLRLVTEIGENAYRCFQAVQRCDYSALAQAIRISWQLNQRLDAGTNPPEIQAILDCVQPWVAAAKLLGPAVADSCCCSRRTRRLQTKSAIPSPRIRPTPGRGLWK